MNEINKEQIIFSADEIRGDDKEHNFIIAKGNNNINPDIKILFEDKKNDDSLYINKQKQNYDSSFEMNLNNKENIDDLCYNYLNQIIKKAQIQETNHLIKIKKNSSNLQKINPIQNKEPIEISFLPKSQSEISIDINESFYFKNEFENITKNNGESYYNKIKRKDSVSSALSFFN